MHWQTYYLFIYLKKFFYSFIVLAFSSNYLSQKTNLIYFMVLITLLFLCISDRLKGIIAMSGTPISPFAIDESEVRSEKEVGKTNNCISEEGLAFVSCMQDLPLDEV